MVALGDLVCGGGCIWRPKRVAREGELEGALEECEANDDAPLPDIKDVGE